jgi:hypothetical protein
VWAAASPDVPDFNLPICRVYIPTPENDAQFYTASPEDCANVVAAYPQFILETTAAFLVAPPTDQLNGFFHCYGYPRSGYTVPVYRVFNGRADANFRYMTDPAIRDQMIAKGWMPLGYGPEAILFCSSW